MLAMDEEGGMVGGECGLLGICGMGGGLDWDAVASTARAQLIDA